MDRKVYILLAGRRKAASYGVARYGLASYGVARLRSLIFFYFVLKKREI